MSKKQILVVAYGLVCVFLIIGIANALYNYYPIPSILPDEYGYWSIAEAWAGRDWSGLNALVSYYSYGYSAILFLILQLGLPPAESYMFALGLNYFMLAMCYFICYRTGKILFSKVNDFTLLSISFVISLYSYNIFHAQMAWVETLLCLMFWLIVYQFACIQKKQQSWRFFLLALTVIYIYAVHQRTLGIVIASISCLILLFINKKITIKKASIFLITLGLAFIVQMIIKGDVKETVWRVGNQAVMEGNDYSGQISKIKLLFTFTGISNMITNMGGRILYLLISTLSIFAFGMVKTIKNSIGVLIDRFKNKDCRDECDIAAAFVFLSFVFTWAITSLYMIYPSRVDQLFYGRYLEWIMGPVLLYGIIYILYSHKKETSVTYFLILIISTLLSIFMYDRLAELKLTGFFTTCSTALSIFYYKFSDSNDKFIYIGVFTSIFLGTLIFFCSKYIKKGKLIAGILLICYWVTVADYSVSYELDSYIVRKQDAVAVSEYLLADEGRGKVYYIDSLESRHEALQIACQVQFLTPDITIYVAEDVKQLESGDILIIAEDSNLLPALEDQDYIRVQSNSILVTLERE